MLSIGGVAVDLKIWYYNLTAVLMLANSVINPFIYAAKYREFQRGVRSLLSKMNLKQQQALAWAATWNDRAICGPHSKNLH